MDRFLEENRLRWDERVPIHAGSAFYDLERFRATGGRSSPHLFPWLLQELGSVDGARLLHLQCHFGMDTLALARLGARVSGLDFSPAAIGQARRLASELNVPARFVCAELRDAATALAGERFDVVFTSLGVLSWLPDIAAWAEAVAACTDPGGTFYIAEFHPLLHVFDDDGTAAYPYLERPEPTTEDEPGTYVDRQAATAHNRAHYWSHGLGQIVTALIGAGFEIEFVHERVEVFYALRPNLVEREPGRWVWPGGELPLLFSVRARRRADS